MKDLIETIPVFRMLEGGKSDHVATDVQTVGEDPFVITFMTKDGPFSFVETGDLDQILLPESEILLPTTAA